MQNKRNTKIEHVVRIEKEKEETLIQFAYLRDGEK